MRLLKWMLLCAPFAVVTVDVQAQATWKPDKAVEIILGVSPGGPQDQMGRLLQKVLQDGRGFEEGDRPFRVRLGQTRFGLFD